MRKLALLASVVFLLSCDRDSTSTTLRTVIHPDGRVEREFHICRLASSGRDWLEAHYSLPEGGEWKVKEIPPKEEGDRPTERACYRLLRSFDPGASLPSDYIHRSTDSQGRSQNHLKVETRKFFFVTTYYYEERFTDPADKDELKRIVGEIATKWADLTSEEIAKRFEISKQEAREALEARYEPSISEFNELIQQETIASPVALFEALEENKSPFFFEDEELAEWLANGFADKVSAEGEELTQALELAMEAAQAEFDACCEDLLEGLVGESIFGIHSGAVFFGPRFYFEAQLALPGKLLQYNGELLETGGVQWEFVPDDFTWTDRILQANSRVIHWWRISSVLVLFALLCAGWRFFHRPG